MSLNDREFKWLIRAIEARPSFQSLTVLDRGNDMVIVRAREQWYLYNSGTWLNVENKEAMDLCDRYYFGYRYNQMLKDTA